MGVLVTRLTCDRIAQPSASVAVAATFVIEHASSTQQSRVDLIVVAHRTLFYTGSRGPRYRRHHVYASFAA
jgi:hypothetical protein